MSAVNEDGTASYTQRRRIGDLLQGYSYFERGDVLVAKITPCFENGKAVHLRDLPGPIGYGSTEFHVLRPGPDLDARYLFHALWNPAFRNLGVRHMTGTAGQKRLPAEFLRLHRVPVPGLRQQRQTTMVLDKVDAIRRTQRESLRLLDGLLRSSYIHLTGPGNKDYVCWPEYRIVDLAAPGTQSIRTGPFGSSLRHSEFVESGVAVLGIDNAVHNRFSWEERRFISSEKYEKLRRYTVRPDDVIITIMGTTGRSAVVPQDIPVAISTKHLAVITVDRTKVDPLFLSSAIHSDPGVLSQIAAANRGAIMPGLNLGVIKRLRLRLPPLSAQLRFAGLIGQAAKFRDRLTAATRETDRLFDSLAQRSFRRSE